MKVTLDFTKEQFDLIVSGLEFYANHLAALRDTVGGDDLLGGVLHQRVKDAWEIIPQIGNLDEDDAEGSAK